MNLQLRKARIFQKEASRFLKLRLVLSWAQEVSLTGFELLIAHFVELAMFKFKVTENMLTILIFNVALAQAGNNLHLRSQKKLQKS
jgi:hypothetical protein